MICLKLIFKKFFFFTLKGDNGKLENDFDKLIGKLGCTGKLSVLKLRTSHWICFFQNTKHHNYPFFDSTSSLIFS